VLGFDRSASLVRVAATRARDESIVDSFFQVADAEKPWPYRSGCFDRVLALDILEHVENRERFLEECRRVLREDGRLLVAVPNRNTSWRRRLKRLGLFSFSDPDHKIEYSREEIDAELRRAGFRVELCAPIVYDTPWYGVIDFIGGISLSLYERLADWKRRKALEHPEESNGFRIVAAPS
jgi:SAM-dependent methyltransferase